jgi:DnaJ-class molecular chaperone with C-terminal Zn finger domain
LGITRTKDTSIIKKAYRGLIKKYHPDTVQAPEKIRRYTIKSVEINKAYKEAMEYAATNQHEPEIILRTEQTVSGNAAPAQQKTGVFTRLFCCFHPPFVDNFSPFLSKLSQVVCFNAS